MKKILTTAIILMASLAQSEAMINEITADNGGTCSNATPGAANGTDGLAKYPPDETQGGDGAGLGGDEDVDGPREGEFAVMLDVSRPIAGKAMKAAVTGERTGNVAFAWFVREPTGAYGDAVCEGRELTPTAADYEHWIRVTATDEGGAATSKEFYFSKLPIVYINTDDGRAVTSKEEYKGATIRIQGNDLYDQQYDGDAEIKGRGNATWTYPKKPYKLKLGSKANLFGFGKNKHWVLLANYNDASLLRSSLAHDVAVQAGVLTMDLTWVDVVFNGEFVGNYQLCEHVRIDPNRVDIFDWESLAEDVADILFAVAKEAEEFSKSDKGGLETAMSEDLSWITTGEVKYKGKRISLSTYESAILSNSDFIASYGEREDLDFDLSGGFIFGMSEPQGNNADLTNFKTKLGMHINVSKPEFLLTNEKMMAFATSLWNEFETSYMAEDGYSAEGRHMSEIADIDAMSGYWLVMEITANLDSVTHSRYSYLDVGSKLQMGPVWDFDFSAGCAYNVKQPQRWYLGNLGKAGTSKYLYGNWANDPYFCLKAYEKYWQIRKHLDDEIIEDGHLDEYGQYLYESGTVNSGLWPVPVSETQPTPLGFEHDVAYVKSYMRTRLEWLDKQFSSVDVLLRSLANLYAKDDAALSISLVNGKGAGAVDATTDFVLNKGEKMPQVRVAVANGEIVKLHAYANGLKYGIYDVADGTCEFAVSADKMVAEPGHRDMVSLIAKGADGKTIARNYLTILNPPIPCVIVNEIMADNGGSLLTKDGKAEDWIELYNPGATDADISGWRLCDSTTKKWSKWEALPEGTIVPAGGYLVVWADDFTGWMNGEVHVNLGLSAKGEAVALARTEGEIVDSFAFGPQAPDVSWGRSESDPDKFLYFTEPTPGAANGDMGREALGFTVTFDANGGTGTMADQLFFYDVPQPLESNAFVKADHVFAGWAVDEDGDRTVYANGEVVSNLTAEADGVVTLFAQWKLDGWSIVAGDRVTLETGLIGYAPSGLPKGLTYSKTTGKVMGSTKAVGEFVVSFTMSGVETQQRVIGVHAEKVSIGCAGLAGGPLAVGVAGAPDGITVQLDTETGVKSVRVANLPAGLEYDAKKGAIIGTPTTAGDCQVVLSVTTTSGANETVTIPVSVEAMPATASGGFEGFVSIGEDNFGTVTLSATGAGKLTAKVVTANGSYSFAKAGWDSVKDGVYEARLETKRGDTLTLRLDSTAAWDANQLTGTFVKASVAATKTASAVPSRAYSVSAQRNAFEKTWSFMAAGDATSGWTLTFAKDAKAAALTLTLKADGTTSIAGKLPNGTSAKGEVVTIAVRASGVAHVGMLREGAVVADFAPILTVGGGKKALSIRTNLWFDRSNEHADKPGEGVGEARFVD